MNNIINQLSQIEEKTVAILDGAADKKKTLAAEYEAKTKQFDEELNHETELDPVHAPENGGRSRRGA